MLAGAGLGDDPLLAHSFGEQRLAHDVVDLVRSRVRQVLAFGEESNSQLLRKPSELCYGRRSPTELAQHLVVLVGEGYVVPRFDERRFEFEARGHQSLGNESSSEVAEVSSFVRCRHKGLRIAHFIPLAA